MESRWSAKITRVPLDALRWKLLIEIVKVQSLLKRPISSIQGEEAFEHEIEKKA